MRTAKRLGVSRNVVRAQLRRFGLLAGEDVQPGTESPSGTANQPEDEQHAATG